ncbi:MAG: helix-hairpin-helix domain-containing protein [Nannocystaceae bacterium]
MSARAAEYEVFIDVDDEEDLIELNNAGAISAETYETLVELLRRGVDLNTADREELFTLPNLSYDDVDAILKYRDEVGAITDPAALVQAGVLDERRLAAIAAFILLSDPKSPWLSTKGRVRYRTNWTIPERVVPPMVLDAEVTTARHLSFGFSGLLTRRRVGDVRWDPVRQGLSATPEAPRVNAPKFFLKWETDTWGIVAGTYNIGFGQRLTFDNTRKYTPNGFVRDNYLYPRPNNLTQKCRRSGGELPESEPPCDPDDEDQYITPDYRWRETLQGVAVGVKRLPLPVGWLQSYGWFSYQNRDIYQYFVYDKGLCEDPRLDSDDNPQCSAPDVYERRQNPLEPTSQIVYATLPNMYRELTAGGNFSYFVNRRSHVGVTGYGTDVQWNVDGVDLDFQDSYRTPFGGPFGAVGVDGAWGHRWSDLAIELTRSFDSMNAALPDTETRPPGSYAGILRHTASWHSGGDSSVTTGGETRKGSDHEIETILRFYDRDYANPYARPLSSADQFEGLRARDEFGGRIRYTGVIERRARLQAYVNLWTTSRFQQPQIELYGRGAYDVADWFTPGLWVRYRDKDLTVNGPGQCYGTYSSISSTISEDAQDQAQGQVSLNEEDLIGVLNDSECRGQQLTLSGQLQFRPHRRVTITPRYQHRLVDDPSYTRRRVLNGATYVDRIDLDTTAGPMRQDMMIWLTISTAPIDDLRVRLRVRYLNQAFDSPFDVPREVPIDSDPVDPDTGTRGGYSRDDRANRIADSLTTDRGDYLEHSLWTYFDVGYLIKKTFYIKLRYDLYAWLDRRESTLARRPNPENRLMLQLEGRF